MEEIILRTGETLKDVSCNKIWVKGKNVTIENVTVEGDDVALYSNYNCSGLVVRNSTFISRKKNALKFNEAQEEMKLRQRSMQYAGNFMNELYVKAKVVDNRYLFF